MPQRQSRRIGRPTLLASALALALVSCAELREHGAPPELITRGWQRFRLEEWSSAQACFSSALHELERLPASAANTQLRAQATYGLAMVRSMGLHGTDRAKACELFDQVVALAPGSELASWAALGKVRENHLPEKSTDPVDRDSLREQYRQVATTYADKAAGEEAFLYVQSLYLQTLKIEDAQKSVDEITTYLAAHPNARFKSTLHRLRGSGHETLKEYPAFLADTITALETREIDRTNPTLDNIGDYYRIALCAEYDVGDFDIARKYFGKLIAEYPNDQKVFNAKLELGRMDLIDAAGGDTSAAGPFGMRPPGGPGGLPPGSVLTPATSAATGRGAD